MDREKSWHIFGRLSNMSVGIFDVEFDSFLRTIFEDVQVLLVAIGVATSCDAGLRDLIRV